MPAGVGNPDRALTVLCPVHPERVEELRACLAALPQGEAGPLATGTTHLGRWVVIDRLDDEDGDPTSDRLTCPYLLFSANLDGDAEDYLRTLCDRERSAGTVRQIWSHCIGYPEGTAGPQTGSEALVAYLLHNRVATNLFYTPYPQASVQDVRRSLGLRNDFVAFAVAAQSLDDEALMAGFRERFGGLAP